MLEHAVAPGAGATLRAGAPQGGGVSVIDAALLPRFYEAAQLHPASSYVAVLDRSPFWEAGLAGVDERDSFHMVLGFPGRLP